MTDSISIGNRRCSIYLFKMWLIEEGRWKGSGTWFRSAPPWSDTFSYLAWQAELETRKLVALSRTNQALLEAGCLEGSAQLVLIDDGCGRLHAKAKAPKAPKNLAAFHVLKHIAMAVNDAATELTDENQ